MNKKYVAPWMTPVLILAGLYNIAFGVWVVLWPHCAFELVGMEVPRYPFLWQCIGMIVGVYGLGYLASARRPLRHWPIIMVGLLGKILGPIGFLQAALSGSITWSFGVIIITNDLIWWLPFALLLRAAWLNSTALVLDKSQDQ
ncbi:MAG: alkyl hydroperoxide reductase [Phycisphaerales bacterium]|nr:alkyl hydroperoxide reductase [Phycisphaerales bacterium]